MSLERKVAVVTGAGSGIGRAAAKKLASRGLTVALFGRTEEKLAETAREITHESPEAKTLIVPCDVAESAQVERAKERVITALGTPIVVVNNAGVVERAPIEDTTDESWRRVLGANLDGTFFVTRAFLPSMRARDAGRFVAVASISSTLGTPRLSSYCAAKWGVVGFMKSLTEELRGSKLCAISVLPGSVDTDMLKGSGFPPAMTPEDVANTIVYAALDAPAAMNGSAIEIFG